jgi:hypothetical protein
MRRSGNDAAFGQSDPTDARRRYDWKTKYNDDANKHILREAFYLGALLISSPFVIAVLWLEYPRHVLGLTSAQYAPILKYGCAWAAGVLGGTLFDLKWLYHTVARGWWNQDRRLWRWFTPHISGGLSFVMLALISSGAIRIFDRSATRSLSLVVGLGFLVGYFSDSAIAKLTEIAETLFGTVRSKEKHAPEGDATKPQLDSGTETSIEPGADAADRALNANKDVDKPPAS